MFGRLLGWYTIYTTSGAVAPDGILPGAKFTLGPSLAFTYIGSVTAQHSSGGRQPNFAAFSRAAITFGIGPHSSFVLWLLSSFFSSPNLSRRRLDVYHTSTHDVALVRI